jgi:hypothetical protein
VRTFGLPNRGTGAPSSWRAPHGNQKTALPVKKGTEKPMKTELQAQDLPRFLRDLLSAPPAEGTGLHQWLYRCACALKPWRDDESIVNLLAVATHGTRRNLQREIRDAVCNARNGWEPGMIPQIRSQGETKTWPKRNDEQIATILADGYGEADLWEASPRRFECESESTTGEMLALLFPGNPLLCIGWRKDAFATREREAWSRFKRPLQFIVPSPMSRPFGLTRDGKSSPKTNANTGPRRFLVIEFDFEPEKCVADARLSAIGARNGLHHTRDLCACLLRHLATFAPLALVVWSGGKSLQGWFPVIGQPEELGRDLFRRACLIGADRATWTPSQFIRVPYGLRDNGNIQAPIYFNPSLLPA